MCVFACGLCLSCPVVVRMIGRLSICLFASFVHLKPAPASDTLRQASRLARDLRLCWTRSVASLEANNEAPNIHGDASVLFLLVDLMVATTTKTTTVTTALPPGLVFCSLQLTAASNWLGLARANEPGDFLNGLIAAKLAQTRTRTGPLALVGWSVGWLVLFRFHFQLQYEFLLLLTTTTTMS